MPIDKLGIDGKICDALNEIISLNEILVEELTLARIQLASRDISIIVYHYPKMLKDHGEKVPILLIVLSPTLYTQQLK